MSLEVDTGSFRASWSTQEDEAGCERSLKLCNLADSWGRASQCLVLVVAQGGCLKELHGCYIMHSR